MGDATSCGKVLVQVREEEIREWTTQRLARWGYVGILGALPHASLPSVSSIDVILCDKEASRRLATMLAPQRDTSIPLIVFLPKSRDPGVRPRLPDGAFDFLSWPCLDRDLQLVLARAFRWKRLLSAVPSGAAHDTSPSC